MNTKTREHEVTGLTFGGPATYRILVKGTLREDWSDRLGGMSITTQTRGEHETVTELVGQLLDQAALAGVLETLYELHLPIVSVTYLQGA